MWESRENIFYSYLLLLEAKNKWMDCYSALVWIKFFHVQISDLWILFMCEFVFSWFRNQSPACIRWKSDIPTRNQVVVAGIHKCVWRVEKRLIQSLTPEPNFDCFHAPIHAHGKCKCNFPRVVGQWCTLDVTTFRCNLWINKVVWCCG